MDLVLLEKYYLEGFGKREHSTNWRNIMIGLHDYQCNFHMFSTTWSNPYHRYQKSEKSDVVWKNRLQKWKISSCQKERNSQGRLYKYCVNCVIFMNHGHGPWSMSVMQWHHTVTNCHSVSWLKKICRPRANYVIIISLWMIHPLFNHISWSHTSWTSNLNTTADTVTHYCFLHGTNWLVALHCVFSLAGPGVFRQHFYINFKLHNWKIKTYLGGTHMTTHIYLVI